jgi:hypothetical protein
MPMSKSWARVRHKTRAKAGCNVGAGYGVEDGPRDHRPICSVLFGPDRSNTQRFILHGRSGMIESTIVRGLNSGR